jgi:peptide/nickel transport system ATP-binding protein
MSELRFDDVTIRFGTGRKAMTAVDAATLVVPPGAVVGLIGESGSGKSTLARAAVGLTPLHGGRILFNGTSLPKRGHRPLQMVFQDPYSSLNPRMTIGDSVAETLPKRRLNPRAEVAGLLDLVGIDPDRAHTYPAHMSGGQRQRVALARALAAQPQVIIADEITSALDVSVQGTVLNLLRDLQRDLGFSVLFISHNLAVVRYVSDLIAVMYLGRILEYGPVDQVLDNPQHPYTRDLLASAPDANNTLVAAADPARQAVLDAEPPDPHHPPAGCHYHPRCPIGPLVNPQHTDCQTTRPANQHQNHAACHRAAKTPK